MDVAIVDSGGANIGSVVVALKRLGVQAELTHDAERIASAPRVLLPGVGAAGAAMNKLKQNGLERLIPDLDQPVLGICLGMQLLFQGSEEDDVTCLGVLPGRACRMRAERGLRVPHMGWNRLEIVNPHPILSPMPDPAWMYFVHSYAVPLGETTLATCQHGLPFTAVAARGNFMAAQFHPERSAEAGCQLLENFIKLTV